MNDPATHPEQTGRAGAAGELDAATHGADERPRAGEQGPGAAPGGQQLLLSAFAEELERCGMTAACGSPGSRNTPLICALEERPQIVCHSHIDERCAGFFALGLAKATGLPAAVTCTSGTALAELLPAVVEAHEAALPLIVLSADRPAELRECGAGQTIDQLKIFGSYAKWFIEVELPDAGAGALRWIRTLACRAYWRSLQGRPGPVHLNFPLREPLAYDGELPADAGARTDGRAYFIARRERLSAGPAREQLAQLAQRAERGIVVTGRSERPWSAGSDGDYGAAAARCAEALGWPLLADPISGARRGGAAIAHYDALLRDASFAAWAQPRAVLRIGALPISKPLRRLLASCQTAEQVAIDAIGEHQDPDGVLGESLRVDPAEALSELAQRASAQRLGERAGSSEWLGRWRAADELAAQAITGGLGQEQCTEVRIARELGELLPAEATLFVSSSMPVRDIESFWPAREDPPAVLCNRGANGIDGVVSSAFGVAAGEALRGGGPTVLLCGDVALAHDAGGLLAASRLGLKLLIVLINNGGGAIFDFLPVAASTRSRAHYERQIATPPELDFAELAALYGLRHQRPATVADFREALERALAAPQSALIEIVGDRAANVALHNDLWRAVGLALRAL